MSFSSKDNKAHISFIEMMIENALTLIEKKNYKCYLNAMKGGKLEAHQGRYLYISDGQLLLDRSFQYSHEIIDHINANVIPTKYSNGRILISNNAANSNSCNDCYIELIFHNAMIVHVPEINRRSFK